jgi:hypothetical protein
MNSIPDVTNGFTCGIMVMQVGYFPLSPPNKEFHMSQDLYALVRLEPETVQQMDITTDSKVAAKWYKDWDCEKDLAANEFKISQKYADCYMAHSSEVNTADLSKMQVGQVLRYHVNHCPACSCQDWIAGDHSGEVLFTGDNDQCQAQMDSVEPLISAWIYPKYR